MQKGKIAVIGAGKWGQALHFTLSAKQDCYITSRTKREIKNFVDLEFALSCEYLVIAIPAQEIRAWLKDNFIFNNQKILVASKGIEASSGDFLNEIYESFVPDKNIGFISGPSFAAEVIQALPCALVINSKSKNSFELSSKCIFFNSLDIALIFFCFSFAFSSAGNCFTK